MRRTSVSQSLVGVVGLLALAGAGCGDWKTFIDEARDNSSGPVKPGTGTGGVSGGAVSCGGGVDANGVMCKRCVDATGAVVYEECSPDSTGSGGATGTDPVAMCVKITEGGPTSCKDYGIWKQYGSDTCAKQMMVLTDLATGPSCGGNSFQSMTYVCCPPAPPPPGGNVTCYESKDATGRPCKSCVDENGKVVGGDCTVMTSPPPAQMCRTIDDGGSTSCKDPGTWKMYGIDRCAQQNLTLTDIKVATTCAGGYSMVTYVCCGPTSGMTTPPPPPLKCSESTDADGRICKSCYDQDGKIVSTDCNGSTGTGGSTGGSQTCVGSAGADGTMCETCTDDQTGKVVYTKCYGGTTPANEICDVRTNADGSQCKTCYYSDGSTVSDCAPTLPPK